LDLKFSEENENFRGEVKAFLAENWPLKGDEAKLDFNEQGALFRSRAIEAGYVARGIPKKYGGSEQDADVLKATVIGQEFARVFAPGELRGIGPSMLVPTLLEKGEEWQKEQFVPPTIRGEIVWCQGYSEPGSGSDLASLRTRGVLEGDEWVINGQKIWTTGAHVSDYMFCLVRTEPEASKHAGISYILIDMKTPGIEVRPLTTMTGVADFNEVFFNDVRVPAKNIVGKRGEGWLVSRATLKHERNMIGGFEAIMGGFRGLVNLAESVEIDGRPAVEDPSIQDQLIELEGYCEAHRYSGYRQLTLSARDAEPGIAGLLNKLNSTTVGHRTAKLAQSLLGDAAMLAPHRKEGAQPGELPTASIWTNQFMWTLGISTAGGTANIQRNVIAERGLGLPRERAQEVSK
jgi:alkylation response protein AidB-like acyl-CoA dehydrogenase